jgi:hypothetical protein
VDSLHTHLDSFKSAYALGYSSSASIEVQMARICVRTWIQFKCINRGANGAIEKWRQDSHTSTEVQIATLSIGRGADICLVSVVRKI